MNEEFKEKFREYTNPAKDAILDGRYEEAFSMIINGIRETKENNEHEITDSLMSTLRAFIVLVEDKYASKQYKEEHYNK